MFRKSLMLLTLSSTLTGCVEQFVENVIRQPLEAASANWSSSPEDREKVRVIARSAQRPSPADTSVSKTVRQSLKVGQFATYLYERHSSPKQTDVFHFYVSEVKGRRASIEITRLSARDKAVQDTFVIDASFPSTILPLVLSEQESEDISNALVVHSFSKRQEDGSVVTETYQDTDRDEISQIAGRSLIGHFFNRHRSSELAAAPCASPALRSQHCYKYDGVYQSIIQIQHAETGWAHSAVPITGLVKATGENGNYELINFGVDSSKTFLKSKTTFARGAQ